MRRELMFYPSHRPYAVDLAGLTVESAHRRPDGPTFYQLSISAVWFRRRPAGTVACYGQLRDFQDTEPATAEEFLERHDDGRYGGDCWLRWDGARLWDDAVHLTTAHATKLLDGLLAPMLDNYPAAPPGYDGWWTFRP